MFGALYFNFYQLNFFCHVGDSSKKYKMAIFKSKPSKLCIFWPNPYRSDLCRNPGHKLFMLRAPLTQVIPILYKKRKIGTGPNAHFS